MLPKDLKDEIVKTLQNKKAMDITVINIAEQTTIADYFIIATAKNAAQAKALVESLEESLEKKETRALRKEGVREARWVVIDYASVIVHIFNDETRDFYNLEKLWIKGDNVEKIV
ncbi:MAG: ribosome silencing factor [Christensenellales bacterium]|nr:ribosome silencing factor [Clostridiales bacterium]